MKQAKAERHPAALKEGELYKIKRSEDHPGGGYGYVWVLERMCDTCAYPCSVGYFKDLASGNIRELDCRLMEPV